MNPRTKTLTTRKKEIGLGKLVPFFTIVATLVVVVFMFMILDPLNMSGEAAQKVQDPNGDPMMKLLTQ